MPVPLQSGHGTVNWLELIDVIISTYFLMVTKPNLSQAQQQPL